MVNEEKKKESRIEIIKKLFNERVFYIGLIVLLLGLIMNPLSQIFIYKYFRDAPLLNDVLLNSLPFFPIPNSYNWVNFIALLIFGIYIFYKKPKSLPYFLLLFGIWNFIRAIFIVLTPFGNPSIFYNGNYSIITEKFEILRFGVYPSGHTGTTFLAFLLTADIRYKFILLLLTFVVALLLLLARGHYSIDIFSAIIFAYAIYCFGEKYLKNKFVVR
ncbi:phosphatase PAP2 family protein [Candidatus Pacearchaeota archaeon]|nr:phosphatase PAP2 family protein [Candidatus Pacearchaeota archaeon]